MFSMLQPIAKVAIGIVKNKAVDQMEDNYMLRDVHDCLQEDFAEVKEILNRLARKELYTAQDELDKASALLWLDDSEKRRKMVEEFLSKAVANAQTGFNAVKEIEHKIHATKILLIAQLLRHGAAAPGITVCVNDLKKLLDQPHFKSAAKYVSNSVGTSSDGAVAAQRGAGAAIVGLLALSPITPILFLPIAGRDGEVRSLNEMATRQVEAAVEARQAAQIALVSDVGNMYVWLQQAFHMLPASERRQLPPTTVAFMETPVTNHLLQCASTSNHTYALLLNGPQNAAPTYWYFRKYGANHLRKIACSKQEYDKNKDKYPARFSDYGVKGGGYYMLNSTTKEETWVHDPTHAHPNCTYCAWDTYWYAYFSSDTPIQRTEVHPCSSDFTEISASVALGQQIGDIPAEFLSKAQALRSVVTGTGTED